MRLKFLFFVLFAIVLANNSYAQFTIVDRPEVFSRKIKDTLYTPTKSNFHVESDAYLREMRRRRRHERNFFETKTSVLFNQFAYVNWAGGGTNSLNGKFQTLNTHSYRDKKMSVDSYFNAAIGFGYKDQKMWKTDDFFELNSVLNYQIYGKWNYSFGINLSSQFAKGYKDNETLYSSKFFAPGTLRPFLGISFKNSETQIITFAPLAGNLLFVADKRLSAEGAFGVTPGKTMKATIGSYINIQWEQKIDKQGILTYKANLQSFYDYKTNPTLSWENWLNITVLRYLSVGLYMHVVFNDKIEVPPGQSFWQLKESLGIGLTYNFKNKDEKPKNRVTNNFFNYKM